MAAGGYCASASRTFQAPGTYTVRLRARGVAGDDVTVEREVSATVRPRPPVAVAAAVPSTLNVGSGTTAVLSAAGSSDVDGSIVSYEWSDGSGWSASGALVTRVFGGRGEYPVTLTVRDDSGLSASVVVTVLVADVGFTDAAGGADYEVLVDASGSRSARGPVDVCDFTFVEGPYTNTTSVAAGGYCASASRTFQAPGTYTVRLRARGVAGDDVTVEREVRAKGRPVAEAAAVPTLVNVGEGTQTVMLSAAGSSDPDGGIVSYIWSDAGGWSAAGALVSRQLTARGEYPITLTVVDADGLTGQASVLVKATDVRFGAADTAGADEAFFDASGSRSATSPGLFTLCEFTFEEGPYTNTADALVGSYCAGVTRIYQAPGTYTVRLRARGSGGDEVTYERAVNVGP